MTKVYLKPLNKDDKYDYFKLISNDKRILETFMCRYEDNIDNFDFDRILSIEDIYSIRLLDTDEFVGIILKCVGEYKDDELEVGYAIGYDYWNNGYCSEALHLFIDLMFSKYPNINTILCGHFEGNEASKKVMLKNNFTYIFTRMNEFTYLDIPRNVYYYKLGRK